MSSCLHSSAQSLFAPIVMDTYRMLIIVLSLNMLIAQLTTTYERIRERLATNFMFLTAMLVLNVCRRASHLPTQRPPPLDGRCDATSPPPRLPASAPPLLTIARPRAHPSCLSAGPQR